MTRTKKASSALELQQKVLPMTQKALRALEEAVQEMDEVVTWICDEALTLGINPNQVNWVNAQSYVQSKIELFVELEQKVKELGYTSLPVAIKALSQYKGETTDLTSLPTVFHKVPKIWLVGRPSTRRTPGFEPLRLSVAQREHKQLVPLLLEAWPMADEESRDIMVKEYLRSSAEDFKQQVYNFIYENEETTLEEELIDTISAQVARERFEDWTDSNALARTKTNKKR